MDYNANYNPPLVPGYPGLPYGQNYAPTSSPFFTVANQFLPRNLHDVIRWCRYITMHSPITTEVIRKYSTYPITDFIIDTKSESTKKAYLDIARTMNLKTVLHDIGFEYHTVGNVFVSLYAPIHRELICQQCKSSYSARNCKHVRFTKFQFMGECPKCLYKGAFDVKDTKSRHLKDMNVIKWDPLNIAVSNNPITGESEYYYRFPNEIKRKVQMGDRLFVDTVPWEFIEAIKNNTDFKFRKDMIFHLKNISAGQQINGIAIPPLISLFNLVFYQATLRRANEAISNDFMSPMRVLYPQAQTGNSDPAVQMSLRNFVRHMENSMQRHRMDRGYVMVSPVPVGYQPISGEGKTLLVNAEIREADETILLSLGVSRELLSGTTNWTSSTVGLRLLKNTLECYTSQITGLLNWLGGKISEYTGWERAEISLAPFSLMDDQVMQQMLMSLVPEGKASYTTLFESFGLDYADELENLKQEAIETTTAQVETKLEVEQAQFMAARQAFSGLDEDNGYLNGLKKAQGIAEELINSDDSTKRQTLNVLKTSDYATYLMVAQILEEESQARSAEMALQESGITGGEEGGPQQGQQDSSETPSEQPQQGNEQ